MGCEETQPSKKEKKGLRQVWKRVKAVFKNKSKTPTEATITTHTIPSTVPAERSAPPQPESTPASKSVPATVRPPIIEVDDTTMGTSPVTLEPATPHALPSQLSTVSPDPQDEAPMQFGKAQAIFAKYNLELSQADWGIRPRQPHERVSKNIRMRVKYTCHNCATTFGHDRVCVGCQHRRCAQCIRYPPKKNRPREHPRERPTQPGPPQNLAAPPHAGAQGACHECRTGLEPGVQECPNCHHQICDRCLQEAAIPLDQPPANPVEATAAEERTTAPG
ncbi:hypothetical protein A1O3_05109 [Capronia epimyces CBS 606.96]|uniref:Uncharacterized protein n=1 Tax=Capronia epimyces CBS 606.96 TaxID=1182542 RepID=W9Y5F6_9EURO|nr:uncharacterized protein A1O3_05109 [Capronia epimyces CBS 606.96]EXJ84441.1 hypothetical protein A1O3_05109 [Capronia epimyces CBS 606.96]